MSFGSFIYSIIIGPLQLFFEVLFMLAYKVIDDPGTSIIVLSLAINFLVLPLYRRADAMQEEERIMEAKLHDGVTHIKKTFKGDERMMILQTYYRQNDYKPTDVFKGSVSLLLEIPFFIAAYHFLSHLEVLHGASFGMISDLGAPDALLHMESVNINILPIIMTSVNLISCFIFTKGYPTKTKVQLYSMAIFFLFFLYSSPAGLVSYWTLNNVFSLVKTIFYKLENPKKVLKVLFAIFGVVLLVFTFGFYYTDHIKFKLLLAGMGVAFMVPLVLELLTAGREKHLAPIGLRQNSKVFRAGVLYMIVMTGLVIPSAVINASPQEFTDINYFVHPLWYICSSCCLSIGAFAVWIGVFRWLAGENIKPWFDYGIWAVCGAATIDYMLFGRNLGLINSNLQYEEGMAFDSKQVLINLLVLAIAIVIMLIIYRYSDKLISHILTVAGIALVVMSCGNIYTIKGSIDDLLPQVEAAKDNVPEFNLSKGGRNVVVMMMDRAMGEYVPYLFNEKPELKEMYSGFTYYPNVISFGAFTNFGIPALYGGYEYSPVEINARNTESLVSKQNEALKVMPVLFNENRYDVTVCDPTYANYQWVPDISIYDDYPDIDAYISMGKFADPESQKSKVEYKKRNFFCYSIMKSAPLFAQPALYDNGTYNSGSRNSMGTGSQIVVNDHVAYGINEAFKDSITTLGNLTAMTKLTDDDKDTFLMISNDATHEPALLREPDYTLSEQVNNTEFDADNADRFTVDGVTLKMENSDQYMHYESNMAAFLRIGEWFRYMKDNGVYDNTRIIIVSDHGRDLGQIESLKLDGTGDLYDTEFYYPLLMVKDFDSTEFSVSDEFMTNADVPTIAVSGLIDNPRNPFTGKLINNDEKYAHDQYILGSGGWDINTNNGNVFFPGMWFSVHDDRRDMSNWTVLQTSSTSPLEQKEK